MPFTYAHPINTSTSILSVSVTDACPYVTGCRFQIDHGTALVGASVRVFAQARRRVQLDFGEPVIDRCACEYGGRRKLDLDCFGRNFVLIVWRSGVQVLDATDLL